MKTIYGGSPLDYKEGGDFFGDMLTSSANCWSESAMMWPAMVVDSIPSIHMVAASVIVLPYAVSTLGLVPSIVVLILSWTITLWLMSWNHEHFGRLRNKISLLLQQIFWQLIASVILPMIEFADHWSKKSMRRNVAYIVVLLPMCYFGYKAFGNHSIPLWLITVAKMMFVIHVIRKVIHVIRKAVIHVIRDQASYNILNNYNMSMWLITDSILNNYNKSMWLIPLANMMVVVVDNQSHDYILINHNKLMWLIALANMMVLIHVIYNYQLSFYFCGTNDGVGRRLGHRVALKSNMGAAAATLANNKGVEILAAAIDSSMTGGVATSAIHSLRLVLDSGATRHVVGDKSILQGYRELANPETGILPDGSAVSMTGVGTIQTEHFTITDVRFVEDLSVNLISVSQLYRQYGMGVWFIRGRCGIMLDDGTTAGGGVLENDRLYVLSNLHVPAGPAQE